MAKLQISIDDELLAKVEVLADEMYISKSGFFSLAANQLVTQQYVAKAVKDMAFAIRKIADNGVIDEESQKQLEDFERFAKLLTGQK
jgi:metal-responsive CopG/Arc/MetJ family transcriptional regulator